jgi:adenine-specific DNA-methyltransferase
VANPPYVRTQVLGSHRSRQLARQFDLTGRVDLYHAFVKAMAATLKPGGVLGLLTSNRFLTVKSGAALRRLFRTEFEVEEVYDMGDTKLFDAAVLPVVVVCRRNSPSATSRCAFVRVYEYRNDQTPPLADHSCRSALDALLDRRVKGIVRTPKGTYTVERGTLLAGGPEDVWSLTTPESREWLRVVQSNRECSFGDLSVVRVGIKTTADKVFLRNDWSSLPVEQQPEDPLLRPLITHSIAGRWRPDRPPGVARVLYPHMVKDGKRVPIALDDYPRASNYLTAYRQRLQRRKYVMDAGRQWYEIWVPHNPDEWQRPKIVFPDIAEVPRFFLDRSGAVVNGDCYWITLKNGIEEGWLLMMLAVANSSFITKYYDVVFHNKLYAGRRRFMTQYVKEFPLPAIHSRVGRQIVALGSTLVDGLGESGDEDSINSLVWEAFGLREEIRLIRLKNAQA